MGIEASGILGALGVLGVDGTLGTEGGDGNGEGRPEDPPLGRGIGSDGPLGVDGDGCPGPGKSDWAQDVKQITTQAIKPSLSADALIFLYSGN
ncbi:hypothetical protein NBRC116583_04010 [Arenicella sp. 4NH20-0111]|uniref:hypothetical protein n=1 Tax=Arenicella sp. 4NH20-0111 TaxID=3127648 RepID=UPI00310C19EC